MLVNYRAEYAPVFTGATFTTPAITGNTTYYAEAVDPATGATSVRVAATVWSEILYVPNAFSPNGDGHNDQLYVYLNVAIKFSLNIYNQWGQLVFISKDQSIGWDGSYKGQMQPSGVYVYYLQAELTDGTTVIKKGTVTLLGLGPRY